MRATLEPAFVAKVSRLENHRSIAEAQSRAGRTAQLHQPARNQPAAAPSRDDPRRAVIDYLQKAYEDAADGGESEAPLIECFLQTPTDPSLAPPGKHILSVFAQYFPFDRPGGWSDAKREAAADKIVAILAAWRRTFRTRSSIGRCSPHRISRRASG